MPDSQLELATSPQNFSGRPNSGDWAAMFCQRTPLVVPAGAENFAFLGEFVETPEDTVFTTEYAVRPPPGR